LTSQLFIPSKIKVGYQNREDTYTKKLAYVIYFDQLGKLRKEKSWLGWCDSKIPSHEFENDPTEGFVLNKGVGGTRHSYGWNTRNEYIRVYDPRDFEFEISVANLLFILRECDCSKGKGLEGKFVYAWNGTELVLLPESSSDYQNSKEYTKLQAENIKPKDLIAGAAYLTKLQKKLTYLGKFDYWHVVSNSSYTSIKDKKCPQKKFVFWNGKSFEFLDNIKSIATLISATPSPDYAELVDKYAKSFNGSRVVSIHLEDNTDRDKRDSYFVEGEPGVYWELIPDFYSTDTFDSIILYGKYQYVDNVLYYTNGGYNRYYLHPDRQRYNTLHTLPQYEPAKRLVATLESGSQYRIERSGYKKLKKEMVEV
jgi:hypothetical protein